MNEKIRISSAKVLTSLELNFLIFDFSFLGIGKVRDIASGGTVCLALNEAGKCITPEVCF